MPHFSSGFRMISDIFFSLQNLLPGTHLFCVYGDNWFQSVRYSCSIFIPPTWTCQVHPSLPGGSSSGHWLRYNDQVHRRKVGKQEKRAWNLPGVASAKSLGSKLFPLLHILLAVRILWDKEEIRCCQGETWERCERNHRTDSGLLLNLKCTIHVNRSISMLPLLQEREGAYTDYQDASALKYSHVPSASRFAFSHESRMVRRKISLVCFINFL